ncbi:hypothetical protein SLE2022_162650 [Rubroshorea leprosula]
MPVLRSCEITSVPAKSSPKTRKTCKTRAKVDPPITPARTHESTTDLSTPPSLSQNPEASGTETVNASATRRSLRLASKSGFSEDGVRVLEDKKGNKRKLGAAVDLSGVKDGQSGKTIAKRRLEDEVELGFDAESKKMVSSMVQTDCSEGENNKKVKEVSMEEAVVAEKLERDQSENESRRRAREEKGKMKLEGAVTPDKLERNQSENERRRSTREEKGKAKLEEAVASDKLERQKNVKESRFSREEKGKAKLMDDGLVSSVEVEMVWESEVKSSVDHAVSGDILSFESVAVTNEGLDRGTDNAGKRSRMEQFRDIARQNASRFAYFEPEVEMNNHVSLEPQRNVPLEEEPKQDVEDWPGPFSTAMKIIRDRAEKLNLQQRASSSGKGRPVSILWSPKLGQGRDKLKRVPPSLQALCTRILVNNADAITSLEHVPDALRHKLSQHLCDSRKMNYHFVELLVSGSPTEIRLKDCSRLSEEEFTSCFGGCDTNNLTVLQLDHCGGCLSDYTLNSTIAQSSNRLPALCNLSLVGAYRLTDIGLSALVSSAPALRSINLSLCSFVTATGIDTIASSLGSLLRELYIDHCENIDSMLMLPALKKIEHLEVLSIAHNESVCDDFICEFITTQGKNIKELILNDCWNLTDSSLKSIAENCSALCALDLGCLSKLTDSALVYLANGCQAIQTLKLCRNAFSDEAIAAYLETSGEPLKELSLNGVKKVGLNTAVSLSKHSRNLITLNLSFCRDLIDEALGLIVDDCLSLRMLNIFGCTQITNVFLHGHSNSEVHIIGLKLSPIFEHLKVSDPLEGPLRYSSVSCQT